MQICNNFMPPPIPPRKFIEYPISSPDEVDTNQNDESIIVGLSSKKTKSRKNITISGIPAMFSSNSDDQTVNSKKRILTTNIFPQKDDMPPQEILNIFTNGINNILNLQSEDPNAKNLFISSIDLRSLNTLSSLLATRANNSSSLSSLLPCNSNIHNINVKLIYDSYCMITDKLKQYTIDIFLKNDLTKIESVSEIGQIYKKFKLKVNSITNAFSPLCVSKLHLTLDFTDIFQQTIYDVFIGKKTINNSNAFFVRNDSSRPNNNNNNNSFNFNDNNGFGTFSSTFDGFDYASNFFQSNDNNNAGDAADDDSGFVVDFDGKLLFDRITDLIIHYFLENVIRKNIFSSSLQSEKGPDEDDLTTLYFNINNEDGSTANNGSSKSMSNLIDMTESIKKDSDFCSAFEFVQKTGNLYETCFIPKLTKAITDEYTPIVTQLYEKCDINDGSSTAKDLTMYFNDIQKIENELDQSLKSVSFLLLDRSIGHIKDEFRSLVFASKIDDICKNGLRLLVKKKDIQTLELCADYAKSTDKIIKLAKELSFDIESVVADCFKNRNENGVNPRDSNPIRESIDYLKMLNELCDISFNNINVIVINDLSTTLSKMLMYAFKKGFNARPDQAARLLADEVNYQFLHLPTYTSNQNISSNVENASSNVNNVCVDNLSFLNDLISLFKCLTCKDVFEAYYHLYLTRRVLMLKASVIQADEFFASKLREICGSDYTKRIDTIFEDLHTSSRVLSDFQKEASKSQKISPRYFKALVLSHSSWITSVDDLHRTPIETPSEVTEILSNFAQFYLSRNPGKQLEWNHHFSRVKMAVNGRGTVKEIQCNGIAATIISLFNNHEYLTKREIIGLCKGNEKIIEECIKVLKSKKSGKLLVSSKSSNGKSYRIDLDPATDSSRIIKLPFVKMILPANETDNALMHIGASRAMVVSANIMLLLKRDHSMDKDELKEKVKEMIPFRLDDDLFEKELENLAKKLYLRLDPSGRAHYLP